MKVPELPHDEELRLQDLYSFNVLDTSSEPEFDELVEIASQVCNCPISLISLLDKDRQWFKAKTGVDDTETSRDVTFCSHAILQEDVFIIEDATKDERFIDNPFVTGKMNVRFYAGAPIVSSAGHKLGTICLIDRKPKIISEQQKHLLALLAKQASRLLETRKKNELLRKRAEEIIALKTRSFRKLLQDHEKHNGEISYNLHEGVAQSIASSLFYVRTAEQSKEPSHLLLTKARKQLEEVLAEVRQMSYTITPSGLNMFSIAELVQEFIDKTSATYRFKIEFNTNDDCASLDREKTVLIIRSIREWLEILNNKGNTTSVKIALNFDEGLHVQITDNANEFTLNEREKEIMQQAIYDRIHAYEGSVVALTQNKKSLLKIQLPLPALRAKSMN